MAETSITKAASIGGTVGLICGLIGGGLLGFAISVIVISAAETKERRERISFAGNYAEAACEHTLFNLDSKFDGGQLYCLIGGNWIRQTFPKEQNND